MPRGWNKGTKGVCKPNATSFKKGSIPWNKGGADYSDETREKMRVAKLGKPGNKKLGKKCPAMQGEKHHHWRGGRSRGYKTGYYSIEYKQWRKSIFDRDGYKCQVCGEVGGYLTAHHIKSFANHPELRFEMDNGVTLCEECHKLTDNYKGKCEKKNKGGVLWQS